MIYYHIILSNGIIVLCHSYCPEHRRQNWIRLLPCDFSHTHIIHLGVSPIRDRLHLIFKIFNCGWAYYFGLKIEMVL